MSVREDKLKQCNQLKNGLKIYDEAEEAIYKIATDTRVLEDFLTDNSIGHNPQDFVQVVQNLKEIYASVAEHRCEEDKYNAHLIVTSQFLEEKWIG